MFVLYFSLFYRDVKYVVADLGLTINIVNTRISSNASENTTLRVYASYHLCQDNIVQVYIYLSILLWLFE